MWRITAFDNTGREVARVDADEGEVTIGREMDRQLILPSPAVSRRHARLLLDGSSPTIVDEGSSNGVFVDGNQITGPTAVGEGRNIEIAEFRVVLDRFWPVAAASAPAPPAEVAPPPAVVRAAPPIAAPAPPTEVAPPLTAFPQPEAAPFVDPMATPAPVAAHQPPPAADAGPDPFERPIILVADGGPFGGRIYSIGEGRVRVGRAPDNQLPFDEPSISRHHAMIERVGDALVVEDLHSSNGSFVNDEGFERATVVVGDELRFGELVFRVLHEGEAVPARTRIPRRTLVIAGAAAAAVLLVAGVTWMVHARSKRPPGDAIAKIAAEEAAHVKAGRDHLAERAFEAAALDFKHALDLDPADVEAKRLEALAVAEPHNEQVAQDIRVKARASVDRAGLAALLPRLQQLGADSAFHEGAAAELATRLVSFGERQCKGRRYADCAWSICTARGIAPASAHASTWSAASESALKEAERKLQRDRSYTPCKLRP